MNVSQAWKKLKKKLRKKRNWSLACIAGAAVCLILAAAPANLSADGNAPAGVDRLVYVCGSGQLVIAPATESVASDCRNDVYFGISKSGSLALFAGKPAANRMIRELFQVNRTCMQAEAPPEALAQLDEGLPVVDEAEYNSVLSTYGKCIH